MFINCHTGYSFKYGTLPVKQLFAEARRCGVHKLALTEINNTASYMEMLRLCNENAPCENGLTKFGKEPYKLDIAVGIEFRKEHELLYIAIAKSNEGFEDINRFLSYHNREKAEALSARAPRFDNNVFIIYPFGKIEAEQLRSYEYIGIRKHQLNQFACYGERHIHMHKFVALHPVTFLQPGKRKDGTLDKKDFNTHRLLRAIANNTVLSKLDKHEEAHEDEYMLPEHAIEKCYERFPEIIHNTKKTF